MRTNKRVHEVSRQQQVLSLRSMPETYTSKNVANDRLLYDIDIYHEDHR